MQPNPLIVRAFALRGTRLWLGTRALVSLFVALAGSHPLRLSAAAIIYVVLLSIAVCFIDTWWNRERALLGNLAVSPPLLAGLFAAPAVIGEVVLSMVGAAFA